VNDFQGTSVVNYCDIDKPYVRIHEPLHLHPERKHATGKTLIVKEFSGSDQNQPSYPIRTKNNLDILMKYKELAELEPNFVFGGRLGDYAYYDMDMTIAAALNMFERLAK
jgi:UDP-galactopyranose mutase